MLRNSMVLQQTVVIHTYRKFNNAFDELLKSACMGSNGGRQSKRGTICEQNFHLPYENREYTVILG